MPKLYGYVTNGRRRDRLDRVIHVRTYTTAVSPMPQHKNLREIARRLRQQKAA